MMLAPLRVHWRMMYLGGKSKIAKVIAAAIEPFRQGRGVWDAFCGGLSTARAFGGRVHCSDFCAPLIALYRAVAHGWSPPMTIDEDRYRDYQRLADEDPLKAFVGFGCSFGGKWFGGFARHEGRNHAAESARALQRDVPHITSFHWIDFLRTTPRPLDAVIYADPPYRGTTSYKGVAEFDHQRFYAHVDAWSRYTPVFVSEYELPLGRVLLEIPHRVSVGQKQSTAVSTERLYVVGA